MDADVEDDVVEAADVRDAADVGDEADVAAAAGEGRRRLPVEGVEEPTNCGGTKGRETDSGTRSWDTVPSQLTVNHGAITGWSALNTSFGEQTGVEPTNKGQEGKLGASREIRRGENPGNIECEKKWGVAVPTT